MDFPIPIKQEMIPLVVVCAAIVRFFVYPLVETLWTYLLKKNQLGSKEKLLVSYIASILLSTVVAIGLKMGFMDALLFTAAVALAAIGSHHTIKIATSKPDKTATIRLEK